MRMNEPTSRGDWDRLEFRARQRLAGHAAGDPGGARFALGLACFLLVALSYPFYSYWVQTRLLAAELSAGMEEAGEQLAASTRQLEARRAQQAEHRRQHEQQERLRAIGVTGISENGGRVVAIVAMGGASLAEARATICAQVDRWRGQAWGGPVEVRRHRGAAPAATLGTVHCGM